MKVAILSKAKIRRLINALNIVSHSSAGVPYLVVDRNFTSQDEINKAPVISHSSSAKEKQLLTEVKFAKKSHAREAWKNIEKLKAEIIPHGDPKLEAIIIAAQGSLKLRHYDVAVMAEGEVLVRKAFALYPNSPFVRQEYDMLLLRRGELPADRILYDR